MTAGAAPPAQGARPRTAARLAAVQALYQVDQTGSPPEAVMQEFIRHRLSVPAAPGADFAAGIAEGETPTEAVPLFIAIIRGWATRAEALDASIAAALAAGWPMHRLDPVLRSIFRAAASELFDAEGAPARVVLDEYMDVAHGFFGPEETRFANGVMDTLAHRLRAQDFPPPPA
jgi:N utilization substance protein B